MPPSNFDKQFYWCWEILDGCYLLISKEDGQPVCLSVMDEVGGHYTIPIRLFMQKANELDLLNWSHYLGRFQEKSGVQLANPPESTEEQDDRPD